MSDKNLPDSYLEYPERGYGMDHDRYDWSLLNTRPKISWPNDKKLALWVNVPIQFFPLNQRGEPFKVPGGMTMPYPDLRHFSLRDYGNRVGIYRLLKAFDKYNISPTFAINARAAKRMPYLMDLISERKSDVICHGLDMDSIHHAGLGKSAEGLLIDQSLEQLSSSIKADVKGWLSPAKNESPDTLDLLSERGIEYVCDWVNDDMPYQLKTKTKPLTAMPLSTELEDFFVIQQNFHSEQSWMEQVSDASDFLIEEASKHGGRLLSLNIHPWLMGQPHRIGYLEKLLHELSSSFEIWSAGANQIYDHWLKQTK